MKYLVPDSANPNKLVIVSASGFTPPNSIALPQHLEGEEAEWLEVQDAMDPETEIVSKVVVVNEEAKAAALQARTVAQNKQALVDEQNELQKLLNDTDWMVIRQAETGVNAPEEVLEQRQAARERISEIRELLA